MTICIYQPTFFDVMEQQKQVVLRQSDHIPTLQHRVKNLIICHNQTFRIDSSPPSPTRKLEIFLNSCILYHHRHHHHHHHHHSSLIYPKWQPLVWSIRDFIFHIWHIRVGSQPHISLAAWYFHDRVLISSKQTLGGTGVQMSDFSLWGYLARRKRRDWVLYVPRVKKT